MSSRSLSVLGMTLALLASPGIAADAASTPGPMVATYDALADSILSLKVAEEAMVRSILAGAFQHGEALLHSIESGDADKAKVETLADLVAQLGNEGDSAVAAIRKKLIEGGHHHNAQEEAQGVYDEGFVIVTRKARKVFLDASQAIAKMGAHPDKSALSQQWKAVKDQYDALMNS